MCELADSPMMHPAERGYMRFNRHRQVPHWDFLEDILLLCRFRAGFTQINAQIIYIMVPSASFCAYFWGFKK